MRRLTPLLALLLLLPATAHGADTWPSHNRLYLLGSGDEFLYWGVDPADPELGAGRIERLCSTAVLKGLPGSERCDFLFLPASALGADVTWNASRPLRFHLALDIETPGTPEVMVSAQGNGGYAEVPAVETQPGVWEASLKTAGRMDRASWSLFSVRVGSTVPHLTATLHLGGRSYVELPSPVAAAGVPRLLARSPAPEQPGTVQTALRSFTFNDDRWSLASFQGSVSQPRDFEVSLSEEAVAVIAWVEMFGTPFTHDVVRGRGADPRKLTDGTEVELRQAGERIARGTNSGVYGVGTNAAVAVHVPSGPVTLHVKGTRIWPTTANQDSPYTAHVLTIYGDRTLAGMRWPAMFGGYPGITATNAPLVGVCPGTPQQPIPVSEAVTSLAVDMRVDTVGGPTSRWALAFLLSPNSWFLCDETAGGQSMRFTYPNAGVQLVGATVKRDTTWAEWRETLFEFEARFAYTPLPTP